MKDEGRVAVWSISLNRLVGDRTMEINMTELDDMYMAKVGKFDVPVWFTYDNDLELDLDPCFDYVWFVE